MVPIRRFGLHHHRFGDGAYHGPRSRISLFWFGTPQVRSVVDLGLCWLVSCRQLPMVLLGVFASLLLNCYKWFYWKLEALWTAECVGSSEPWVATDSRVAVLVLPGTSSLPYMLAGVS